MINSGAQEYSMYNIKSLTVMRIKETQTINNDNYLYRNEKLPVNGTVSQSQLVTSLSVGHECTFL